MDDAITDILLCECESEMDRKTQDMKCFLSLVRVKQLPDLILSALLGVVVTLQGLIEFTGDVYQKLLPDTFRNFRISDIFVFLLATLCFYLFIIFIRNVCGRLHIVSENDEADGEQEEKQEEPEEEQEEK